MITHKNLPNFLIAGAPKSGTTTLWGWLKQHPSIFMSEKKETHFLIYNCKNPIAQNVGPDSIKSYPEYLELFENVSSEIAIGEASPGYLCDPDVPFEIDKTLPGAKVIAILRDPVERAWSSYKKSLILGEENGKMSFLEALESETVTDSDPWNGSRRLIRMGLYGEQLTRYFSAIGTERVLVHLYEDLNDPQKLLRQIYEFLEVDPDFLADTKKSLNVTKEVKSEALHRLLSHQSSFRRAIKTLVPKSIAEILRKPADKLFSINYTPKPELPKNVRAEAIKYFREDIEKTSDLVSRDLTHWLT